MTASPQKILMVAPDYFGVSYTINPWMEGQIGHVNQSVAHGQWNALRDKLQRHVELVFAMPQIGLPDYVFTANAALVMGNKAIISRFHNKERQGEEPHYRDWFIKNGFTLLDWPSHIAFEGAGDALFDRGQNILWVGYGFRSDESVAIELERILGVATKRLRLVDPRFYHLDTCLCPLEGGYVMYYPAAFDAASQDVIAATVPEEKRIVVGDKDAFGFACNAVDVNRHVILNVASPELQDKLRKAGFTPVVTMLTEFLKAGGAAKCLTLKLVEP